MAKYRKRPVVIEAEFYTGRNADDIGMFVGHAMDFDPDNNDLIIHTLEGDMRATPGDYIIKGVQGEFYPCKPSIFKATYEAVEE